MFLCGFKSSDYTVPTLTSTLGETFSNDYSIAPRKPPGQACGHLRWVVCWYVQLYGL